MKCCVSNNKHSTPPKNYKQTKMGLEVLGSHQIHLTTSILAFPWGHLFPTPSVNALGPFFISAEPSAKENSSMPKKPASWEEAALECRRGVTKLPVSSQQRTLRRNVNSYLFWGSQSSTCWKRSRGSQSGGSGLSFPAPQPLQGTKIFGGTGCWERTQRKTVFHLWWADMLVGGNHL